MNIFPLLEDINIFKILYCSILLHFPLNYNQFSVLCANTC
jgi:hypothetical protein